jgi:hypothetical protein
MHAVLAERLQVALLPLSRAPLECDGLTSALTTVLTAAGLPHTVYGGALRHLQRGFQPPIHFWIMLDEYVLDFRARMWLGESDDVPHGVFRPSDFPDVHYEGRMAYVSTWPPALFSACTQLDLAEVVAAVTDACAAGTPHSS